MVLEQKRVEAVSTPYLLKYFYLTPVLLFAVVLSSIYLGLMGLAAAVVGVGPFTLYVLYQEFVDKPYLEICEDGIYYDRRKMEDDDANCIFPYIEIATSLVNVGNATAEDCHVRVSVDEIEFLPVGSARFTNQRLASIQAGNGKSSSSVSFLRPMHWRTFTKRWNLKRSVPSTQTPSPQSSGGYQTNA